MWIVDGGSMSYVEWQTAYATGIETIDTQHRQLIALINRLAGAVEGQYRDEVADVLQGIRAYIEGHFSYEEQLFGGTGYRFAESHIRSHRRFVQRLDLLTRRFEAGGYVTRELLAFLHRWLLSHIANDDQDYVSDVMRCANSA